MNNTFKVLLTIEMVALFSLPTLYLWIGIMLGNFGLQYLLINTGLILGIIGAICMLIKVIAPKLRVLPRLWVLLFVFLGMVTVVTLSVLGFSNFEWHMFHLSTILQIIGTTQLMYHCREYLFYQGKPAELHQ